MEIFFIKYINETAILSHIRRQEMDKINEAGSERDSVKGYAGKAVKPSGNLGKVLGSGPQQS